MADISLKPHKVNLPRPVFAAPKLDFGVIVTTGHRKFPFMENTRNNRAKINETQQKAQVRSNDMQNDKTENLQN